MAHAVVPQIGLRDTASQNVPAKNDATYLTPLGGALCLSPALAAWSECSFVELLVQVIPASPSPADPAMGVSGQSHKKQVPRRLGKIPWLGSNPFWIVPSLCLCSEITSLLCLSCPFWLVLDPSLALSTRSW